VRAAAARQRSAAAARDLAQATLAKTKVRAPFDGVVILKDAEVGEVVSPSTGGGSSTRGSVVTMVDFDSLEAQVELSEVSLEAVAVGAPATIFLDAHPEEPYTGRVDRLWPTANRQKGTVEVRIAFERRDERLRPEMGLRVVFAPPAEAPGETPPATEPALLVPESALIREGGRSGVLVVERGVVHLREVATGNRRSGKVAITGGLEPGEEVVLDPPPRLGDGDRILRQED
jgi:RND family efflux transporter MFP subunit